MSTYHSSMASVSSRRGRYIVCHVLMLDETNIVFEVPVSIYVCCVQFTRHILMCLLSTQVCIKLTMYHSLVMYRVDQKNPDLFER